MRAIHRGERKHKEGRKAEGARGGGGRAEEGAGCARVACSVVWIRRGRKGEEE